MANKEHLEILKQGIDAIREWHEKNPNNSLDFEEIDAPSLNLSKVNLDQANFYGANLENANFSQARLSSVFFRDAILTNAAFIESDLSHSDLSGTDFRNANLSHADLSGTYLEYANFEKANLDGAIFREADISNVNFSNASFCGANFGAVRALNTDFSGTIMTGACIQDWNINESTNLEDVVCEYVYLKARWISENEKWEYYERRPSDRTKTFAPGEFITLVQKSLSTVDLIFADGIDWKAFFASFQELQQQYANDDLAIQAIERKGGAFVIRLETAPNADKGAIERDAIQKYEEKLQLLETKYHTELNARDREIEIYKRQGTDMMEIARLLASRPINVEAKAEAVVDNQSKSTNYDLRNSKFGGGFAAEGGTQSGGTFNDYSIAIGQNIDDIMRSIASLKEISKDFPDEQREEAEVHLEDLEEAVQNPEKRKPSRLKRVLIGLMAVAGAIGTATTNATDFAETLNKFTDQVLELSEKLEIAIDPLPEAKYMPSIDIPAIEPEE